MSGLGLYRQGLRGCKSFLAPKERPGCEAALGGFILTPWLSGSSAHTRGSRGVLQLICVCVCLGVLWFANSLSRLP